MTPSPTMHRLLRLAVLLGIAGIAQAQEFNSGSDGSRGALNITANTTIDLPPDGILHCTTIDVASGATLRFNRNALNTPVYLLATGNVTVNGTIDVSGGEGSTTPPLGGRGGPGGFDGGAPGIGGLAPGAGKGPGGGAGGTAEYGANGAGGGYYGTNPGQGTNPRSGTAYGTPLLVPMVGGSGGGASAAQYGGGGGGGAILIASSTRITMGSTGRVLSHGGYGAYANGSGGGVRLVAPMVAGNGTVSVGANNSAGGAGRIRIDSLDRSDLRFAFEPVASLSLGSLMMTFPNPQPRLDILNAAGTAVAEGTAGPVRVMLPFGSSPDRTITVQARDFGASVPIRVTLTPENGTRLTYDTTIDNLASNPATATVNVTFPVNVLVHVHAWTR